MCQKQRVLNNAKARRIKYAWLRWAGYPPDEAQQLSHRAMMPPAFYDDLDRWFFYRRGRLSLDPTNGKVNRLLEFISEKLQKDVKNS